MTTRTALELVSNYPDQISITSSEKGGKHAVFCYLLNEDKSIHKLMLSSEFIFNTAKDAEDEVHELAKSLQKQYNNESN